MKIRIPLTALRALLSRAGWTAVQVVLAAITVEMFDLPAPLLPIFAVSLSVAKSYVAAKVGGDPDDVTFRSSRREPLAGSDDDDTQPVTADFPTSPI